MIKKELNENSQRTISSLLCFYVTYGSSFSKTLNHVFKLATTFQTKDVKID